MVAATVVTSCFLALAMAGSAVRKLGHSDGVVAQYRAAGVPEERLTLLAAILLLGAAGLIAGLAAGPLGVAAGAATCVYFVLAIISHARAGDMEHAAMPAGLALLAAVVFVTRLASL
jgi:hypothetical protein